MRLAHVHFKGPISYARSLALQNALIERHFSYKDWIRGNTKKLDGYGTAGIAGHSPSTTDHHPDTAEPSNGGDQAPPAAASLGGHSTQPKEGGTRETNTPPDATVITFSTTPTYTVGRRHLQTNPISKTQQSFLSASGAATFHASPRGGLLTYHAPGQLTGYVVGDLRRFGITPRCWVRLLENSVMRTCAAFGVENTTRTDDPGVWIRDSDRKICAIGVQVSRGITSHGVGLNVFDHAISPAAAGDGDGDGERYPFTKEQLASPSYEPTTRGYLSWGFSRIVACGLEGKSVTWMDRELPRRLGRLAGSESAAEAETEQTDNQRSDLMSLVGDVFAREISKSINEMGGAGKEKIESVYRLQEPDELTQ